MNGIKPRGFKFISILSRSPVDKLKSKNNYSSEIQTVRNFIDHASWSSWLQLRKKERKKRENRIEKETRSCPIFFPPSLRSQWTFNTGVERGTQLLWSNGEGERKRCALCRNLNGCHSEIKKKKRKRKEKIEGDNIVVGKFIGPFFLHFLGRLFVWRVWGLYLQRGHARALLSPSSISALLSAVWAHMAANV